MQSSPETPGQARNRLTFTFVVAVVLLALAHLGAEAAGLLDGSRAAFSKPGYRTTFTLWAVTLLLTAAEAAYFFSRSWGRNASWLGFWTFGWIAFLFHLGWRVALLSGTKLADTYGQQPPADVTEVLLTGLGLDLVLLLWWGLDVALAWLVGHEVKAIQIQRGALHLFAFVQFFRLTVLADEAGVIARLLGIVMTLVVVLALALRLLLREADPKSFLSMLYVQSFHALNQVVPWHRLPTSLAVLNIGALREVLRAQNLHNTSDILVTRAGGLETGKPFDPRFLSERDPDGYFNDLEKPAMGSASVNPADPANSSDFTRSNPGARFGRNIPLSQVDPLRDGPLGEPNPRRVSNELLARPQGSFTPATTLNLLAAAWIQFQTHDWFNHGTPVRGKEFEIALGTGDAWHESPMKVRRTRPDPTRAAPDAPYPPEGDGAGPATYVNAESHWWDASQVYGSSAPAALRLRALGDGKLKVRPDRLLPEDLAGVEQTGLTVNWWVGLSLLHNLFALEHNAICDRLKREYPHWTDDQLYRVARLVNSALMAKIHTVDWTPAILAHPALEIAMNANWWGLAGERLKKAFGRVSASEAVSGIPGSEPNHHAGDYCLTEEFVSVYRMHPLMPDGIALHAAGDGRHLRNLTLGSERDDDPDDVIGPHARARALAHGGMEDLLYSFGVAHPGALVLQNFPNWMRRLKRRKGADADEVIDLATIDILRDRERGVPRYNRFRRLFHLPPFNSLDQMIQKSKQLRGNPQLAQALKAIYQNDISRVDLMVGLFAETPPEGFGFSDTAFRVFILMASRRLKSDRFLTRDFTPAVYTPVGIDWVENTNMAAVLLRHYPELTPALQGVANPFAPWRRVGG